MPKYRVEVEFDDDGAAFAGAHCGTQRRAEIITVHAVDKEDVPAALVEDFRAHRHYATIRRIGDIEGVNH